MQFTNKLTQQLVVSRYCQYYVYFSLSYYITLHHVKLYKVLLLKSVSPDGSIR